MTQQQVLFDRWEALNSAIQVHKLWLESLEPSSKRLEILHCLLSRLEEFAKGQFNFFCEGFRADVESSSSGNFATAGQRFAENSQMVKSDKFPPDHVLKTILDQISDDLDVIRRATADEAISNHEIIATLQSNTNATLQSNTNATLQSNTTATILEDTTVILQNDTIVTLRNGTTVTLLAESMPISQEDTNVTLLQYGTNVIVPNKAFIALHKGDCLVRKALNPAQMLGLEEPIPLTYFQKSAAIRVIPYDNDSTALIGLPFTCMEVPRDFLAIPHEAGHFVFWNGAANNKPMWQAVREAIDASDVSQWIKPWTEEIFADVYGCLLAGPVIALSFQDLQLLESFDRFVTDDGVHPTPLVRPHVYSQTLKLMGNDAWVTALDNYWQESLKSWQHPSQDPLVPTLADQKHILLRQSNIVQTGILPSALTDIRSFYRISIDDAKQELIKVIGIIYNEFLKQPFESSYNAPNCWWNINNHYSSLNFQDILKNKNVYTLFEGHLSEINIASCSQSSPDCEPFTWVKWVETQKSILTDQSSKDAIESIKANAEISSAISEKDWETIWNADGWATRGPMEAWP